VLSIWLEVKTEVTLAVNKDRMIAPQNNHSIVKTREKNATGTLSPYLNES
jgi:hypothetical protein